RVRWRHSSSWITSARTRLPARARPSRTRGASLLYLPPYSPDLNPRAILRQAQGTDPQGRATHARGPLERDGNVPPPLPPSRVCHYFENAGYVLPNRDAL